MQYKVPILIRNLVNDGICWLAGGALRALFTDEAPQDYDLFFSSAEHVTEARKSLDLAGFSLSFECPEGKLFTYVKADMKVQIICERFFASAEEVIDSFDIIPGCAVLLPNGEVLAHLQFLFCMVNSVILFHKITYPASTLRRVAKYGGYGFIMLGSAAQFFIKQCRRKGMSKADLGRVYID